MSELLLEIQTAARRLVRARTFSATVVATLALGTGVFATTFALADAALLRPLPLPAGDRLVAVTHDAPALDLAGAGLSLGTWRHYHGTQGIEEIAVFHEAAINLTDGDEAERRTLALVTPSFFRVLGVGTQHGRLFEDADGAAGAEPVIVLGHALWMRRYGGDAALVGRTIDINERPRRVIGVLPPGAEYPHADVQLWMNITATPDELVFDGYRREAIARLAEGSSPALAQAALQQRTTTLASAVPDLDAAALRAADLRVRVTPLAAHLARDAAPALRLLLCAALLVLAVAVANATGLVVARSEYVRRDVAVRSALGAGRTHLVRFFAAEAAVLAVGGAVLGLLAAAWALPAVAALSAAGVPRVGDARIDGRALGLGLAVAGLLVPALLAPPLLRFLPVLRDVFGELRVRTTPRSALRVRRTLLVAQLALCTGLVVGAVLLGRSFLALRAVDPGFDAENVLTFDVRLPFARFQDGAAERFHAAFLERIEGVPGVVRAGATTGLPLTSAAGALSYPIEVEGRDDVSADPVRFVLVTPGYFETLAIETGPGWTPAAGDRLDLRRRVLVSAALARRLGGEGARIRRVAANDRSWLTVAGVVGDVRDRGLATPAGEIVYVPVLDATTDPGFGPDLVTYVVAVEGDPLQRIAAIRAALGELDGAIPLANARPFGAIVDDATSRVRFTAWLVGAGAAVALLLAAVGIQGLVAWSVAARTHEFGIRMALGARRGDVDGLVVREAAHLTLIGLAIGILPTLLIAMALGPELHPIGPLDPVAWTAGAAIVLGLALPAAWIPALRAGRVPPARALAPD